jgi:hypothetical protein
LVNNNVINQIIDLNKTVKKYNKLLGRIRQMACKIIQNILEVGSWTVHGNFWSTASDISVPDHESRDRDVVLVRRTINLGKPQGVGKLERGKEWGGMGRGRSVYEQPGTGWTVSHHIKGGIPSK